MTVCRQCPTVCGLVGVAGRRRAGAGPLELGVGQPVDDAAHHGQAVEVHLDDLVEGGRRPEVEADVGRVGGRVRAVRVAERVVRPRLVEHRARRPGVDHEHQVAQRLDERPLVVDPLLAGGLRQVARPVDGVGPQPLDRVPGGTVVVGRPHLAHLHTLGVSPVELALDVRGDVDVVHDEPLDEARHGDVGQPRVDDLHAPQVAVSPGRAGEVGAGEPVAAERAAFVVVSHGEERGVGISEDHAGGGDGIRTHGLFDATEAL